MVRYFMAGLCTGMPLGCYLREQGYHKRLAAAYKVLRPGTDGKFLFIVLACILTIAFLSIAPKMSEFRDTAGDFYRDLQKGRVEQKDFEKHIYGQFG